MKTSSILTPRLASLDMLRGIAIAGMVLVNNPGSWQHMFAPLRHASWSGYSPADLVFPFFLFAVGAAQSFSLAQQAHTGKMPHALWTRILYRTVLLFALGVFLNALPGLLQALLYSNPFDPARLRIMGVLQRIAIVYFSASICIVYLSKKLLWTVIALLLAGYGCVLALFPGPLAQGNNPAIVIDCLLLGSSHLYTAGIDPEGLFSSISALVTTLLGYAGGCCLRHSKNPRAGSLQLLIAGVMGIALGSLWGLWLPVCKDLWTGPYVLITAGWAALVFALCHETHKVRGLQGIAGPLQVLGRHSLFFFLSSGIASRILLAVTVSSSGTRVHMWSWLYENLFAPWLGRTEFSSLGFAGTWLALWWLIVYLLDRHGRAGRA